MSGGSGTTLAVGRESNFVHVRRRGARTLALASVSAVMALIAVGCSSKTRSRRRAGRRLPRLRLVLALPQLRLVRLLPVRHSSLGTSASAPVESPRAPPPRNRHRNRGGDDQGVAASGMAPGFPADDVELLESRLAQVEPDDATVALTQLLRDLIRGEVLLDAAHRPCRAGSGSCPSYVPGPAQSGRDRCRAAGRQSRPSPACSP